MGLGPKVMKNTDLVCILRGCDFPVVMRGDKSGCFQLIGAAYVVGFMHGQFGGYQMMRGIREEELEIC